MARGGGGTPIVASQFEGLTNWLPNGGQMALFVNHILPIRGILRFEGFKPFIMFQPGTLLRTPI